MSTIIHSPVWEELANRFELTGQLNACIAYVTNTTLPLKEGDVLLCDASYRAIQFGSTTANALLYYLNKGVKILSNQNLHAKFIVSENILAIGSANLSNKTVYLLEAALVTNERKVVLQSKALFITYAENKNTIVVTRSLIEELLKVKVIKDKSQKTAEKPTKIDLGDSCWYIRCYPLGNRAIIGEETEHNKRKDLMSRKYSINPEHINFIRWRTNTVFGGNCKIGDLVILRYGERRSRVSHVYPPAMVFDISVSNGYTYIYYGTSDESKKLSYSSFVKKIRAKGILKGFNSRTRIVTEKEFLVIESVW